MRDRRVMLPEQEHTFLGLVPVVGLTRKALTRLGIRPQTPEPRRFATLDLWTAGPTQGEPLPPLDTRPYCTGRAIAQVV
jgi:hypothetical protein